MIMVLLTKERPSFVFWNTLLGLGSYMLHWGNSQANQRWMVRWMQSRSVGQPRGGPVPGDLEAHVGSVWDGCAQRPTAVCSCEFPHVSRWEQHAGGAHGREKALLPSGSLLFSKEGLFRWVSRAPSSLISHCPETRSTPLFPVLIELGSIIRMAPEVTNAISALFVF